MQRRILALLLSTFTLAACSSSPDSPATTGSGGSGAQGGGTSTGSGTGAGGSAASCAPSYEGDVVHLAAGTTLAPGEEKTMCLRWTTPEALDITAFQGSLGGPTGHHSLLFSRPAGAEPDGLSPCSEAEIMDAQTYGAFELLAGVSYESAGKRIEFPSSPVQIGLRVPAGTQLVFDAHFVNPSGAEVEGCATIDLERGTPVVVSLLFRTVLPEEQYFLTVPAHGSIDATYEEPAGGKYRIAAASSHMHAGATHFRMSIKETGKTLYETSNWAEPQPAVFATEKVVIEDGQTFQLECSFANDGPIDQHFPEQMCVGGMYLLPCSFPGAC